ncbi:MAG: hypothetical protein K1060chlam2_01468 [Chlamydiae bacterium]|nr:hypothetical protein [Chlamydiota bacterium]
MSILIYRNSEDQLYKIPIEEFEKRVGIKYLDSLIFERPEYREKLIKKSQKRIRRPHLKQMNSWTLALHQKAMERPREDLYYIRWISGYFGYGVFAAQDIPALCYVGEYLGLVRKKRFGKFRFNDYVFGYVAADRETPYIIDAKEQGNFARFINHSDEPNLTSRWVVKDGLTHIILFANKLIPKDSQLTYDYGEYYWRSRSSPSLIT